MATGPSVDRSSPARPSTREAQLDGLRCLAFFAVFTYHTNTEVAPWGWGGVEFFFALSGFLITRILARDSSGRLGIGLGRFYFRRTLRIFPLYYALVAAVASTHRLPDLIWYLTYTYNIHAFWIFNLDKMLGHFWTLCVEEQFYLLYPPALLLTPARYRFALIAGLIAATKAFQGYAEFYWDITGARFLLPYSGEHLLWGSLAGLIDLRTRPAGRHEGTACFLAGLPTLILAWNLHEHRLPLPIALQDLATTTLYGIGCSLMVFGASRSTDRWIIGPLSLAPVAYLGRISYGLYAFHIPVIRGWITEVPYAFLVPKPWGELAVTIVLAAASWHFFEGPINRLKDRVAWAHRDEPRQVEPARLS